MKIVLHKKVARKTLLEGLALLGFLAVAFLVVLIVHAAGDYKINGAGWGLLGFLALIYCVQWLTLVFFFEKHSSPDGEKIEMSPLQWALSFIPGAALLILVIVLYSACSSVAFFDISGRNFALGVTIVLLVLGILCVGAQILQRTAPLRRRAKTEEVVMRVVGKNDPEAANAVGSVTYGGGQQAQPRSEYVFPDLMQMDEAYAASPYAAGESADITLSELCAGFNVYLESKGMYYSMETLRSFVGGMACSRLLILEGLSGIGKTSLPRYFSEYIGANVSFTPVQSSWRDRSDVLGYYNDFAGAFKETPFLRALYQANYETDEVNLLVLDEMNLSRVEYYFADFLSVLELDRSQWKIELMPVSTGGKLPEKLKDCTIRIPENVWFIGTANKDDSIQALTDKVYDRAIAIEFTRRKTPSGSGKEAQPLHIGSDKLARMFESVAERSEYAFKEADRAKFLRLSEFMYDTFEVNFGNRILNQIEKFVPVYLACGGKAGKAVDLMFSRKVLRKLDGRFEEDLKDNLERLEKLVVELYGAEDFSETLDSVAKLKRKSY